MPISIRLPATVEKRIDSLAKRTGRTKSFYLRELINRGFEEMEDYFLSLQTVENVKKGKAPLISFELATRTLGLPADYFDTFKKPIKNK